MVRYRHHYLHNNFVVTLLNDLFGIQARGGCSCAGPYMHRLLGVGPELSREYVCMVENGLRVAQAGVVAGQLQLLHLATPSSATSSRRWTWSRCYGHLLLARLRDGPDSPGSGATPRASPTQPMRLSDLRYASGRLEYPSRHARLPEDALERQLEAAMRVLDGRAARGAARAGRCAAPREGEYERLRWFAMPEEVAHDLHQAAPEPGPS